MSRRGSVVASWLLDLTASALAADPELAEFQGRVSDSGEGRWTLHAAIDEGVPVPALSTALFARFVVRDRGDMADKVLSAMRAQFGGHVEVNCARGAEVARSNPSPTRWFSSGQRATWPSASCSLRCTGSSGTARCRCR